MELYNTLVYNFDLILLLSTETLDLKKMNYKVLMPLFFLVQVISPRKSNITPLDFLIWS